MEESREATHGTHTALRMLRSPATLPPRAMNRYPQRQAAMGAAAPAGLCSELSGWGKIE